LQLVIGSSDDIRDTEFPHAWRKMSFLSVVFAAFEKTFPLFLRSRLPMVVDGGGKERVRVVFQSGDLISTSFPQ
jgi:hypothetical protein